MKYNINNKLNKFLQLKTMAKIYFFAGGIFLLIGFMCIIMGIGIKPAPESIPLAIAGSSSTWIYFKSIFKSNYLIISIFTGTISFVLFFIGAGYWSKAEMEIGN